MTIQTLKKTIWSQIDQSMQPFVPSYREINKTLWQVKKIIHSTQIDRMLCNMLGPYRSSSMPTLFVAASTWDLQTNVDLGKSDIIHTCKLMFSTNSFNKRVNQGKEKGEKTKNSSTCIIQHPVLLYWLQVFRFRPMLCGFLKSSKGSRTFNFFDYLHIKEPWQLLNAFNFDRSSHLAINLMGSMCSEISMPITA